MDKHATQIKTSLYFPAFTKAKVSLLISVFLYLISNKDSFDVLIHSSKFYTSVFFGFFIALAIIEFIHWDNVLLDRFYNWSQWQQRIPLLIATGIIPLVYLDWLLVKSVFNALHLNFKASRFTEKILPVNAGLICLGHIFHFLHYQHQLNKIKKAWQPVEEQDLPGNESLMPSNSGDPASYHLIDENEIMAEVVIPFRDKQKRTFRSYPYWTIIECYIQNRKYIFPVSDIFYLSTATVYGDVYFKNGKNMNMNFRRKSLRENLDPNKFIEIRGGVFVAFDAINGIKTVGNEHTLIYKKGNRTDLHLTVSRRFLEKFIEGFKTYQVHNY